MSCFAMLTLRGGRIFPLLGADGATRLFEDYEQAMAAAERENPMGYAIYENLNNWTAEDIAPDENGLYGADDVAGNGTH